MASTKCNCVWPTSDLNCNTAHLSFISGHPPLFFWRVSSPPLFLLHILASPLLYLPPRLLLPIFLPRSSSLFSSLSTGWAGQLPEYNLKLWDLSLYCRITHSNYTDATETSLTFTVKLRLLTLEDYNNPPQTSILLTSCHHHHQSKTQPETQKSGTSGPEQEGQTSTGQAIQSDSVEWIRPGQDRPEETSKGHWKSLMGLLTIGECFFVYWRCWCWVYLLLVLTRTKTNASVLIGPHVIKVGNLHLH